MECNKEEAIRAKEVAETKLHSSDFLGARKFALKAQQLFPDLENISHLLTVCEVHCSAQNKLHGSELDWYGILQLEKSADDGIIKKQYRKLALLLHPDKNKLAGAEAAFKLIGEANRVLSDPTKRSQYDMKCRAPPSRYVAPKPPPHQAQRNTFVKKQQGGQNPTVTNTQFTGLNSRQPSQTMAYNGRETFWTCCPFCNMRYQYFREVINKTLRCQSCEKPFIAYDMGPQGTPSKPVSLKKGVPKPAAPQVGSRSAGRNPLPSMGVQGNFTQKTMGAEQVTRAGRSADVVGGSKAKGKEDRHVDVGGGKEGVGRPKSDAAKVREPAARNTSGKRGRQVAEESSESVETASSDDTEDVVFEENGSTYAGQSTGPSGGDVRRSSRQKQHVSYNENASDDDDFVSPPKKSKGSGSSSFREEEIKPTTQDGGAYDNLADSGTVMDEARNEVEQKARTRDEDGVANRKREAEDCKDNTTETANEDHNDEKFKVEDNSESIPDTDPEILVYPDPDFSDFDKEKAEHCFEVDQVWAIYDTIDGMPRFYARIKKISPGFKLRITWLEANPDDPAEVRWAEEGLPVACGKFKYGSSQATTDCLMFSQRVQYEKISGRNSFVIYPRRGETWALFKDWDIGWSSDPEKHQPYKYDFVEILSDFVQDAGIGVAYLGKVKGFVSLFKQTARNGILSFRVSPSELFKFSHQIPSFRMTGAEREGVPVGSLELDPVSLPSDLNEFCDLADVELKNKSMDAQVNGSCSKFPERNEMLKKHDKVDPEGETLSPRRSLRESNSMNKKHSQVNAGHCMTQEEADKNVNGIKEECRDNHNKSKGSTSFKAAEEVNTPKKHETNDLERGNLKIRRSPREFNSRKHSEVNATCAIQDEADKHLDGSREKNHGTPTPTSPGQRTPEAKLYDFNEGKSEEKLQVGQIWALNSGKDKLPIKYAQIKKIDHKPEFSLHVALLEALSQPRSMINPVCCGAFKLKNNKTQIVKREALSHLVTANVTGKVRFEIYPKQGEVWAIYKNWNSESMSSNPQHSNYDIVEVLEVNNHCIKVSVLVCINPLTSLYKAPRRQRSSNGIIVIPQVEILPRFSHQIPAFLHNGEKDIHLRDCWQLDPSSIPGTIICLD